MSRSELGALQLVVDAFDELGVAYAIGGSLASSAHGVYRATLDSDLVADLRGHHVTALERRLAGVFYLSTERMRDAIARQASFNLIHLALGAKVDVFVAGGDPLARAELGRRRQILLPGPPPAAMYVVSAEDIVLQKLRWFRLGHGVSERQWLDVLGVLRVQGPALDLGYLHCWAPVIGVADLLQTALGEADLEAPG